MQTNQMTLGDAVEILKRLLEEFAFRSGGGDGDIVNDSIRALAYLESLRADKVAALQEAINTGDARAVLKLLEVLRFELIPLYLEDVALFAPYNSEARGIAKQMLVHLNKVRLLRDTLIDALQQDQEVE